jgi:ribonuclease Z
MSNGQYFDVNSKIALRTNNLLCKLESIPVKHCKESYGLILYCANGEKIVYSGDCRPSESLIRAGKDCHLLIHEATFDDSLAADAISKKHSTVTEAFNVGRAMRAHYVVLTHFSQRYPKSISTESEGCGSARGVYSDSNYVLAHDFLRFSFPSQTSHLNENLLYAEALNEAIDSNLRDKQFGELKDDMLCK